MKSPLKNKIFFSHIWLFGQNLIGYLAYFRLVIRLMALAKIKSATFLTPCAYYSEAKDTVFIDDIWDVKMSTQTLRKRFE